MESTPLTAPAHASATTAPTLSLGERAVAVFTRPTQAWTGLGLRPTWWFPVLITIIVVTICTAIIYERAMIPMQLEGMNASVEAGTMQPDSYDKAESFLRSSAGRVLSVVPVVIFMPIATLITGLVIWFGVGFVLGSKLKYWHAVEVAAWSSLVSLPGQILMSTLAWFQETMRVHVGFGVLVPMDDPPTKLQTFLGGFLDGIGPLAIWYCAVIIIGASVVSGAKRSSVMWVLGGLYLAIIIFMSAMGALFAPGT